MRLLMATGDEELGEILRYWLRGHGYSVSVVQDGEEALATWQRDRMELALLDAGLPKTDGVTICRRLAAVPSAPLIVVMTRTAHGLEDELCALEAGAAACVTMPFSPALLLARLRSLVRRAKMPSTTSAGESRLSDSVLQVGSVVLDASRHEVTGAQGRIRLTPIESRLLHVLMTNAGQVLPTATLVERVWGYDCSETEGGALVKTHMRHLRQKVEWQPSTPRHLVTVPGCGYSFMGHSSDAVTEADHDHMPRRLA